MKSVNLRKILPLALAGVAITCFAATGFKKAETDTGVVKGCRAACLIDADSGECAYAYNEHKRMPIASVCKVMTLTVCLDAVEEGRVSLVDEVTISSNAAGMGGSQIFLHSGGAYPLGELVKSIVVCSANDSCVAVAEYISGSEDAFVADMNGKAKELGLDDTLFANCTGLPKDTQYSCAADVAKMFANLIKHEEYFNFSKVWLEDFTHSDGRTTVMTNTNKLLKRYNGCDGGKTGFTNDAGFCLVATAKRGNMRLVASVLGGSSSENRFSGAASLFDYGFGAYENRVILDGSVTLEEDFTLRGGKKPCYSVRPADNCYVFTAKNKQCDVTYKVSDYNVKAPVSRGQQVGKIDVYRDGVLYKSLDVVAAEDVAAATFTDRLKECSRGWNL